MYPVGTAIEKMEKVEVTLEMAAVYKGVPVGPAIINCTHPACKKSSFKGVGVFNNQGILSDTSFACINGYGWGYSSSKMVNGRPAANSYRTYFFPKATTLPVDSSNTDVTAWTNFTGHVDILNNSQGQGKELLPDGNIYIGDSKNGSETVGKFYKMKKDGTYTQHECVNGNLGKEVSKGHKIRHK
jgi:hypothetical protein